MALLFSIVIVLVIFIGIVWLINQEGDHHYEEEEEFPYQHNYKKKSMRQPPPSSPQPPVAPPQPVVTSVSQLPTRSDLEAMPQPLQSPQVEPPLSLLLLRQQLLTLLLLRQRLLTEARLIKTMRSRFGSSELPQDLRFFKNGREFLRSPIWRKEMVDYQSFITELKYTAGLYLCPECKKYTIKRNGKTIYQVYSEGDWSVDHRTEYWIYLCYRCQLGWTEFKEERSYVD